MAKILVVLCIIALPLFAVLGIFSVKYRRLAKDALKCLFSTATLRKCESGLDERIKGQITGKLLFFPALARFVYKFYNPISLLVLVLMVWSAYASGVSLYNVAKYGNCNAPEETGFCILDPTGEHSSTSVTEIDLPEKVVIPEVSSDDPVIGGPANLTLIEFGCYSCPYTKKAEPIVAEILKKYNGRVNVQFKSFLIGRHNMSYWSALAADCAFEQDKYLEYHKLLFENQEMLSNSTLRELALKAGLDMEKFEPCLVEEKFSEEVMHDSLEGMNAGVRGTPTFFIGNKTVVGPKPFRTFDSLIREALK